ncbi:MAG: SUMF1/EgtB/PvdO family nonheme iron enzyme [Planctomycetes bacterium]|nr:SUMF1/EgtB/PvdO family nonheme iron enzyme [Planctomycetota bacterium]
MVAVPNDPTDTLLAQLLDGLEHDPESAMRRLRGLEPTQASRVLQLIDRLRSVGLVTESRQIGRFRLQNCLGRGAMGIVWRATDQTLDREVAVKVLAGPLLSSATARQRFAREARAIATLRHPGIVTVLEVGEDEGVPFLVMEFVDGGSLLRRIEATDRPGLGVEEVCRIGIVLADALQSAHVAGIVHRDVKPSNVLLRTSGAPLLADFGLACVDGDATLTASGELLGTPAYAAPELIESGVADVRSDVYALGATLFHALTRRPPYEEQSLGALLRRMTQRDPPRLSELLPGVSPDLDRVIGKAIERDAARRYGSAAELGDELGRCIRGEPVRARAISAPARIVAFARRRPALAAAIVLPLGLTLVFVVTFILWQNRALRRYEQLADTRVVDGLRAEVATLWPAVPETVPRMKSWLERTGTVLGRAGMHRVERDRLATLARRGSDGRLEFGEDTHAWQYGILDALSHSLESLAPLAPLVESRMARAREVVELTVAGDEARELWRRAADAIANSPRYGGLRISPQLGLLPLGENAASGLFEFWHALSGERPDPEEPGRESRWRIAPDSGLVFVLVPGGRYTIGSRPPSPDHPEGSPHVDPEGQKGNTRVEDVELHPYFLAKYETTQSQWERFTGTAPSQYDHRLRRDLSVPTCPVESVAWEQASTLAAAMGLALPTDVQWEVAWRAGSTSRYPRGDHVESMYGTENVLDQALAKENGWPLGNAEPFDDGFPALAPVGSFVPNAFGFHDLGGNVGEFCADDHSHAVLQPRAGDGLLREELGGRYRACRGSDWSDDFSRSRSSYRDVILADKRASTVGVRFARALFR